MTAITLTAGDFGGSYQGYSRPSGSLGVSFGSISNEPAAGHILDNLITGAGNQLKLTGDSTAKSISLTVDGTPWTLGSGIYGGGGDDFTYYTVSGGTFVNTVVYSVDLGVASVPLYDGPTWVGNTAEGTGVSTATLNFSATGRAAGDKLYIAIATANTTATITTPTGFTPSPESPQNTGTNQSVGAIKLYLFEKDSDGTETTVGIADSGDHTYSRGFVIRPASGQTIAVEDSDGKPGTPASTTHTGLGLTTSVDDCLILTLFGTDRDSSTASYSSPSQTGVANLTERFDFGNSAGLGSGLALFTAEKQAAGSVGALSATSASNVTWCAITLALKNDAGGGGASVGAGSATSSGSGVGEAIKTGAGAGAATATGSGVGRAVTIATGSATATASGTGVGGALLTAAGSAASSSSGSGFGGTLASGNGSAAATSAGTGVAAIVVTSTGSATATSSGNGVAVSSASAGSATATSSGQGVAIVIITATGSAAAISSGVGTGVALAVAQGAATATSQGNGAGGMAATATGSGAANSNGTGVGVSVAISTGSGTATSTCAGVGGSYATGAGLAEGFGAAVGDGYSIALATGEAVATSAANGVGSGRADLQSSERRAADSSRVSRLAGRSPTSRLAASPRVARTG